MKAGGMGAGAGAGAGETAPAPATTPPAGMSTSLALGADKLGAGGATVQSVLDQMNSQFQQQFWGGLGMQIGNLAGWITSLFIQKSTAEAIYEEQGKTARAISTDRKTVEMKVADHAESIADKNADLQENLARIQEKGKTDRAKLALDYRRDALAINQVSRNDYFLG